MSPSRWYKLFISYASQDRELAERLEARLKAAPLALHVWRDKSRLLAGDNINNVINKEIWTSDAVLTIWSNDSLNSNWVRHETALAVSLDRVIFVAAPGFDPKTLPEPYRHLHCADFEATVQDPATLRTKIADIARMAPKPAHPDRPESTLSRRSFLTAIAAVTLSAPALVLRSHLNAQKTAYHLYSIFGLSSNPVIVFGDQHLNYPSENEALLSYKVPSATQLTSKAISDLAYSVQPAETLRIKPSIQLLLDQTGTFNAAAYKAAVDKRSPLSWRRETQPQSIISVGSAKTNLLTRQLLGYWTREFQPKFVAMDGSWHADLAIDQLVDHSRKAAISDPYSRNWVRFNTRLIVDGKVLDFQNADHFMITRLVEPGSSNPQKLVIVSARHRPGQIAARRLFEQTHDPLVAVFASELFDHCRHEESWQAWAEVNYTSNAGSEFMITNMSLKEFWPVNPRRSNYQS